MASTPVGSNALILEVLNRNNYKDWRPRMNTYLLAEDLWEVVEAITEPVKLEDDEAGYKAWTKKNAKALYAIQNSCGREMFSFIREIKTAKSAWEVLEQECKVVQGYDGNNADHFKRYISFTESVSSGDWDKAKECLGEVDVRSVARAVDPTDDFGDITLHVAARKGHIHILKELAVLMPQEDLKMENAHGFTALHIAVKEGHVQIVKELGPWMGEVKDGDGDTALHIAVKNEQLDIVKELVLLMSRGDLKMKNDDGYTALHLAVNMGNMPIVKEFVTKEEGENNITEDDFDRYIPFTDYVINGDWDNANESLRELDDPCGSVTVVDPRDDYGDTALHAAARQGHVHILKKLLSLLKVRQEEVLELKTAQDFTTFGSGINLGISEEVLMERAKYMVEQYEKMVSSILNVQNAEGSIALHLAVLEGSVDIVKELVQLMRQEGLEIKDVDGDTALQMAVRNGNVDIVKELVQLMRQEGLEIKDADGDTALQIAIRNGNVDIVKELVPLMRKEGLEIKDADGDPPLQIAVRNGNVDIVKELVQLMRQEGLEIKDADGDPPLQIAIRNGNMDIVRELMPLMRPEAMEEKDGKGNTALGCATYVCKNGEVMEIAKYMAENNNKVFGIPSPLNNDIPVVWALRRGKWELARYLYSVTQLEVLNGPDGSSFLWHCLNTRKEIDLAWDLLRHFPNLAFTNTKGGTTFPMLKLARMSYAFLSGTRLTRLERWIYDRIHIREVVHVNNAETSIYVAKSEDDHADKRDFISSVMSLFGRFVKGLRKLCGIHRIYEMKSTHKWIFEFLRCIGEATRNDNLTPDQLDMVFFSIFKAIEQGHFEFVTHICKANPKLLLDLVPLNMFHFAIEYRQEEVYDLIYGLEEEQRNDIGTDLVNSDNSMLHYAANLSSHQIQDASLQMQRELQWFKEVESVVPPEMHEHRNSSDDMTARELFTKNHKKLMEDAENSIKGTATSCTVVGALIVTIMFAVAFTVPGGNNGNTGLPLFLDQKLFKVFIVSDTISLASSTTSVIIFLGILTSRYAEDDFLKSLPTKILIGLVTLFLAITTMMIAFSCALAIMLDGDAWIVSLSVMSSVPVISFVWFLFPLLVQILKSTYGHGIFDRKVKPWL